MERATDRGRMVGADAPSGIQALRGSRRRLGCDGDDLHWDSGSCQLCRHPPEHANRIARSSDLERSDGKGEGRDRRDAALQRLGLWVFQATEYTSPDLGLWPERLPRGATRVDIGEVLVVDRLRRTSGKRTYPRRTARQCDAVLAAGKRRIFSAPVLGKLSLGADGSGYDPGGLLDFSKRDFPNLETLG